MRKIMTNEERDDITEILKENGFYGLEIQEYCFDFLRQDQKGLVSKLLDALEEEMGS